MNGKKKTDYLRKKLIDAQDGELTDEEMQQLKQQVLEHDPDLWEDHLWMTAQHDHDGVFHELAAVQTDPPRDAIQRLHQRRESGVRQERHLEELVWSWFRRYVLTIGILLMIFFAGLEYRATGTQETDIRDQVETFLGWEEEDISELDHWLYEDFQAARF